MAAANVAPGSSLASIANSASGKLDGKKSTYVLADEMQADALSSLSLVQAMGKPNNPETGMAIGNIKSMSYLSLYYANKIRGATFLKANDRDRAKKALGEAYGWWVKYADVTDETIGDQIKGLWN